MRLPHFDYYAPNTLEQALRIKRDAGNSAAVLAGGTDLVVNLKHRLAAPSALLSLKNLNELRGVEVRADAVVIRAATALADVANHDAVRTHFPILVQAIQRVGAIGIQHYRGTIGGNLCLWPRCVMFNQSLFWRTGKGLCHRTGGTDCLVQPGASACQATCCGDTVPVLVSLSAQLTVTSSTGTRTLPVWEFFTGRGQSPHNMSWDEILTEIRLPIPWTSLSGSYQRLASRSAVDFPFINAAAVATLHDGMVENLRLTLSAAGPAPIPLREVEVQAKGTRPDEALVQLGRDVAVRTADGRIIETATTSRTYRVKMAGVVAARAMRRALRLDGPR
jgi:4-hydroxybenzoyl-CoA reductase subunit beta